MGKGKGKKKMNKGANPLHIPVKNLTRSRPIEFRGHKKNKASTPVKCRVGEDVFNSFSEAARIKKRSRTYIARIAQRI